MFKRLKRLFKRKKYAPVYPAGGYINTSDLYGRARSGEMVINSFDIAKRCGATFDDKRFKETMLELEAQETIITEEEVSEAVANALSKRFRYLEEKMKHSTTNCPNCGAPLHGNKCDYCGTEQ